MFFKKSPQEKLDQPLYNSRLLKNYVEYVNEFYPEVDTDSIVQQAGLASHEVNDPGYWFNQYQVDRFHEIFRRIGDPDIARKAGRYAVSTEACGTLRQYALGVLTPASAYRMFGKFACNMTRAHHFETRKLSQRKVEVTVAPEAGVRLKPYQCDNIIGLLESVAKLFTNKYARVEHPNCIHKGDKTCRYIVTWENPPSLKLKLIRNYFVLMAASGSVVSFFFLASAPWLIFVLCCLVITTILSSFTAYLEKTELKRALESQGDVANALLDEMNLRSDNAQLIQEIGQAISTILDVDELIKNVMRIMEKRLDFDRGMVMLANKEKTRLVHKGGYGYSREEERLLQQNEFHLDKPESRGVFVLAFKEQRPFLVNDVIESENQLSKRALELAKELDVHSLICVPIVYEKESLGILAVDNVRSKRPLAQSDLNLLAGVASQTGVSIVNARSFQRLQESEKKYRELVENANSIILRMNTSGTITFFNEFAQNFFGYTEKEILGKNVKGRILPYTERGEHYLEELVSTFRRDPERRVVTETEVQLRNGDSGWVAWTYKPIFDSSAEIIEVLCIGNDITKLKTAGEEKENLQAQLLEAQKMEAVGTLAGGIAHDFNNILQGISSYAQLLLMKKESDDPEYDWLENIKDAIEKGSDLTRRLLIFSRKMESELKPVDLKQEVVQVSKMLERIVPKMIKIEFSLAADLKTIDADPIQIEQIIMNLGVNARDAMPEGGKLVFRVENTTLEEEDCKNYVDLSPGDYVQLCVSDTGCGMDKNLQEHIFEPFFTTKEKGEGTGLGLAVVYGIVKNHAGHITCDSSPGKGTTFKIFFPAQGLEGKHHVQKEKEFKSIKGGEETILLVDDEEYVRNPTKAMLSEFGYKVLTAEDGKSACEVYRNNTQQIDLVILDLIMPEMGGGQCLEHLLKINPNGKVIVTSGYTETYSTKKAISAGAKGFVAKPFEAKQLLDMVREVLENN